MLPRLRTEGQALPGEVREGCTGEAAFALRLKNEEIFTKPRDSTWKSLEEGENGMVLVGEGEVG